MGYREIFIIKHVHMLLAITKINIYIIYYNVTVNITMAISFEARDYILIKSTLQYYTLIIYNMYRIHN